MNRNRVWLHFMQERISRLDACLAAGQAVFFNDTLLQDAAVRNLQVLADASTRLSGEVLESHPELNWHWLYALRNMLVHEPLNVDPAWLWECLEFDLPLLRQALDAMLL
jgi:uncharacterized protein with HEPN domain